MERQLQQFDADQQITLKELKFLNKLFDFKVKFMGVKPGNGHDSKKELNEH